MDPDRYLASVSWSPFNAQAGTCTKPRRLCASRLRSSTRSERRSPARLTSSVCRRPKAGLFAAIVARKPEVVNP